MKNSIDLDSEESLELGLRAAFRVSKSALSKSSVFPSFFVSSFFP